MPANDLMHPVEIPDLLNYRLYRLVAASGAAVVRLCEGKYGISRREWYVLGLLASRGTLSPSDMADSGHLDRAQVSKALARMLEKRLLRRQPRPDDRRRALVELTEAGRALYQLLFDDIARLNVRLASTLSATEQAPFLDAVDRLTAEADRINQEFAAKLSVERGNGSAPRASRLQRQLAAKSVPR